jgi:molybdopterin synthase sulfur carrier subunit
MEIIYFGQIGDIVGNATISTETFSDTDALKASLEEEFPKLREIKYRVAVNKLMVQSNTQLNGTETIALMPPFSGG